MTDLAMSVLNEARRSGRRIVTAESCTGGLIAAALTEIAGSSDVVEGGFVTYSNAQKTRALGVPEAMLADHGAVSEPVAAAMASGALAACPDADLAVAVTGVAGPGGGSAEKPVGTVWLAVARRDAGVTTRLCRFDGDRAAIRTATVAEALAMLKRALVPVPSIKP